MLGRLASKTRLIKVRVRKNNRRGLGIIKVYHKNLRVDKNYLYVLNVCNKGILKK